MPWPLVFLQRLHTRTYYTKGGRSLTVAKLLQMAAALNSVAGVRFQEPRCDYTLHVLQWPLSMGSRVT